MTPTIAIEKAVSIDIHMRVTWILIAGLFVLRIPLRLFAPTANWVDPIFQIGTYFLGAILIWWERNRLADFHIDQLAVIIFIIGKPLELLILRIPSSSLARSTVYFLYVPIALSLGIALRVARPSLPKLTIRLAGWILIGIMTGIALGVYSGSIIRANAEHNSTAPVMLMLLFLLLPFQQMFYAGIAEEPFFRGFLWGALRKAGVRDGWVWLIQASLFWLAHAYYLVQNRAWSFFFIVSVGSLVLGLLAWRSRSIAVSIVAHGLGNGIAQIVGYYK